MAPKDMRLTFYYSDEAVFAKVKEWRTRDRIVKWANEFYDQRYGLRISEFPFPYNERVYKKFFCLKKADGLKADYTGSVLLEGVQASLLQEKVTLDRDRAAFTANLPADPAEATRRWKAIEQANNDWMARVMQYSDYASGLSQRELEFRRQVRHKTKEGPTPHPCTPSRSQVTKREKERLVVIFCEFINWLALLRENSQFAETFRKMEEKVPTLVDVPSLFLWSLISPLFPDTELLTDPFIIINPNQVTKCYESVLAHEIVHAAGGTRDNQGIRGSIMNYEDKLCKDPSDVILEEKDKAKIEAAFFVE
jgi:hypothetical protein